MTESRIDPLAAAERPAPANGRQAAVPKRKQRGSYRFTWLFESVAQDRDLAERGWSRVQDALSAGTFAVLILAELTYCLAFGRLDAAVVEP